MKALVFAAGLGTRLKPLTDTMPKALVPVGGVPMLQIVLEKLRGAGYDEVIINVHHFADQIVDFVKAHDGFGMNILFSDETDLLRETGGGIRHAARLLKDTDEPVLVHNVDIISNLDLKWFRSCHRPGDLATILVSKRKTARYFLFDEESRLTGWTNIETGIVRSPYGNIDTDSCTPLAFAGIHLISPEIFSLMEEWPEKFPIVDFYLSVCRQHTIRGVEADNLQMKDLGKITDFQDIKIQ